MKSPPTRIISGRRGDIMLPLQPINNMKKIIAALAVAILSFAPAIAEEVTYVAGMTGVV